MQRLQGVRRLGVTGLTAAALMLGAQGAPRAELLDLSTKPLFLKSGVAPNIIVTLDDSGSMGYDYMPDDRGDHGEEDSRYEHERFYSSTYNGVAYNPNVSYAPPLHADGKPFSTAFPKAFTSPFTSICSDGTSGCGLSTDLSAAFYTVFNPSNTNLNSTQCDVTRDYGDDACYDRVTVSGTSEQQNFANWYTFYRTRNLTTITGASRAFANLGGDIRVGWQRLNDTLEDSDDYIQGVQPFTGQHRTDFYTWLFKLPASGNTPLRAALQRAGKYYSTAQPYLNDPTLNDPTDPNSDSASCRQNYHALMTDGMWNGDFKGLTPSNYDGSDHTFTLPDGKSYPPQLASPFADANDNALADLAFQYWAEDLNTNLVDNVPPYMPQQGDSADANYWNAQNDPANWQHMVNFTVGLGLGTFLTDPTDLAYPAWGGSTFAGDYPAIAAGDKSWPVVGSGKQNNVYDLWHAAINSRGQFFSANDPKALGDAFKTILNRIADRTSSGTSVAIESGAIAHSENVYIARFNSRDWTGQVVAYKLINNGDIGAAVWDAACALNGGACATDGEDYDGKTAATRHIVTWNPQSSEGVPFAWDKLAASQQDVLNGDNDNALGKSRLLYLRGDRSQEQSNSGDFRNRQGLLGDVVDATPVYVGPPDRFYPDDGTYPDGGTYNDFKTAHSSRDGVVYVGANDGMLHAFAAADGEELFAYVPSAVYDHLNDLTDPGYSHRFYVDATPTEGDAFFDSAWHTILVGGLRAGGQGVYALDITDAAPSASETSAAAKVLWEFTDSDDPDLGYTYSQPQIVRMHNGHWAAVFGNGYNNSNSGHAVLYVVDIADGSLIKKIDTLQGTTSTPNGLATVTPADIDGDGIVDYLYAGDLLGNLWKFDVTNGDASKWKIAYGTDASPTPLFTAVDADGTAEPITTAPSIRRHPTGKGYLLMFGTGKYLENNDAIISTKTQSVYGIWDRDRTDDETGKLTPLDSFTRDALLKQTIMKEVTLNGSSWRVLSNNTMTWYSAEAAGVPNNSDANTSNDGYLGWYMDLTAGEMQVTDSLVRGNRLIFTTLIPNEDPCSLGGDSWLIVLDYRDGGRFNPPVFDTNNDGVYDLADMVEITVDSDGDGDKDDNDDKEKVSVSGQKHDNILQTPALGSLPNADRAYLGGSDGKGTDCAGQDCTDIGRDPAARNRQSWLQLR